MRKQRTKGNETAGCPRRLLRYLLILFAFSVLILSGCRGASKEKVQQSAEGSAVVDYTCISHPESEKKIYVILKNFHGDYWKRVIEGIEKAAGEMDDTAVYLGGIDNETDSSGQITLLNQAVEENADGILLAPANSSALIEPCYKIRKKHIPLVLIDSSIDKSEFDACYMTDNMEAGKLAAQEMVRLLKEAGNTPSEPLKVGILLSSDTSQAMVNRISGFLEYWSKYAPARWEIEPDIFRNGGDVRRAQTDAEALLNKYDAVKGIFGCNNTSSIGIVKALFEEKRTDVVMVGFDLAQETKELIQNPDYRCVSLLQQQDQMGYLGMGSLYARMNGEVLKQKYVDTGIVVVDSDYLMENGDS